MHLFFYTKNIYNLSTNTDLEANISRITKHISDSDHLLLYPNWSVYALGKHKNGNTTLKFPF